MKRFSDIVRPITRLIRKNVPFEWTEEFQHLFQTSRKRLMTASVLAFPDLSKPFIIYSDASYYCVGAVLSREHEIEGKIQKRPIAYQFSPTQLKYALIGKETYAVYRVVQKVSPIYIIPELY